MYYATVLTVSATVQTIIKKFATRAVSLLLCTAVFLCFVQPAAQAAPSEAIGNPETTITGESVEQLRAERRAKNSQAARAANDEVEADSLGEVLNKKLNLEEIAEENVIVDDTRDALDLDAPREIPRRGN